MSEYIRNNELEFDKNNTAERLGLPSGFITEKGSVYQYNRDGSIHRDKFDGTQSEAGIAVFVTDTSENSRILSTIYARQSHVPVDKQRHLYIIQFENNDDDTIKGRAVYKALEVKEAHNLALGVVDGAHQFIGAISVSIEPQMGSWVFEMDKLPDGRPLRHSGHKVVKIIP